MEIIVRKWGNSAAVRIPAAIMRALRLDLDAAVDVREENGRIVIEPIRQPAYDLELLLADINPANIHAEVNFGADLLANPFDALPPLPGALRRGFL